MNYLSDGLGAAKFTGNTRSERDAFVEKEKQKQSFIKGLVKGSISPKEGLGNLLKVPQIYTSIVLSTKPNFNYKLLPKVHQVLLQNAERGACSLLYVNMLYEVTGMFPQGYGVTYIPYASDGNLGDMYEYALVTRLFPKDPEVPFCRQATRSLKFINHGHDLAIDKSANLYFNETAKSLANINKKRLQEILEQLSSNYEERKHLDLVPRCWHPKRFLFSKKNIKTFGIKCHSSVQL